MLVLAVVAVYGQTLGFGFTSYDDPMYVSRNAWVQRGLSWDGLRWAFTSFHGANWFPLTWLSLMLDVEIAGLNARMLHGTNLLLHAASSLLLFQALDRASEDRWKSAWVAALFALHPLHVESVAWITERKDVLSGFFWFLTLLLWLRWVERPGRLRYAGVVGAFAAGLLSKPMVVSLPLALLLFDFWPLARYRSRTIRSLVWEKLPLFGLALLSSLITLVSQRAGSAMADLAAVPLAERLANSVISYAAYLQQTFWPVRLSVLYPYPLSAPAAWSVLAAALVLLALSGMVAKWRRSRPYLVTGWLWYLGTLVPVIGIVQFGPQVRADRFTYLPLVGIFIMLAWGLPDLLRFRIGSRALAAGAAAALVAAGWGAHQQCGYWRDPILLFERALEVTSQNPIAHGNLASSYLQRGEPGDLERARFHFQAAIEIDPSYQGARNGLARALRKLGRVEEAIARWSELLQINPQARAVLCDLCEALTVAGRLSEAEARCVEAIRKKLQPGCAHYNLGKLYLQQERILEAERQFDAAVRIRPKDAGAHLGLGVALMRQNRLDEARAQFEEAQRLNPSDPAARAYLEETLSR
jgi:Flp pilus assembly protein TadD